MHIKTKFEVYAYKPSVSITASSRLLLASNVPTLEDARAIRELMRERYSGFKIRIRQVNFGMEFKHFEEYYVVVQRDDPSRDSREYIEADNRTAAAKQAIRGMHPDTVIRVHVYRSELDFRAGRTSISFSYDEVFAN